MPRKNSAASGLRRQTVDAYRDDLAYIHDAGFGQFALAAAGELIERLRRQRTLDGLIVDLGCGSGILSQRVVAAGYRACGFDISPAMVALARTRVSSGEFHCESFLAARLPRCVAVAAIGEVFNYLFDAHRPATRLPQVFRRVHKALAPGGLFLFDVATPGRAGPTGERRAYTEADDWACLFSAREDRRRRTLVREITTFRRDGPLYRRDHETHRLRLYARALVAKHLRAAGFRARALAGYGSLAMPPGWVAFVARKV